MESEAVVIRYCPESLSMTCFRRYSYYPIKALCIIWISWFVIFHPAVSGPCLVTGTRGTGEEKDKCGLLVSDCLPVIPDSVINDVSYGTHQKSSEPSGTLGNIGSNSGMFFFPSTLDGPSHGSLDMRVSMTDLEDSGRELSNSLGCVGPSLDAFGISNLSWSFDYGMSNQLNGREISCSLISLQDADGISYRQTVSANKNDLSSCRGSLFNHKVSSGTPVRNTETIFSSNLDDPLSPRVEIDPPILDWGEKYLYIPSLAYITVSNTWNDSSLHIYQPFSMDSQFFPCNFSEAILGPGEVASICFVFLPKLLGWSSTHLILQTSFGGFIVQAKGFAAEFPYGQVSSGLEVSSSGRWRKNFSLFNPFDETIHVEEIAVWVTVSLGSTSLHMDATCSARGFDSLGSSDCSLLSIKDWFLAEIENIDAPLVAMRPVNGWEIHPHTSGTVGEIDLSFDSIGRIFGAFCVQLTRASQDEADIIVLPVEAEIDKKTENDDITGLLTVSLEGVSPHDAEKGIVTVSLRNIGSHVVIVDKISEVAIHELFQIKYMEGLLLFPRTTTVVALVSCTPPQPIPDVSTNCRLLVQTNNSRSPVEILCKDIVYLCSKRHDSSVGPGHPSSPDVASGNLRTGSLTYRTNLLHYAMALETADLDKLVLQNWKLQGTGTEVSVLEDHELLFSVVQVGDHLSKWITVRNPSQQPVVMQLILNPVEIMDECKAPDDTLTPVLSDGLVQTASMSPEQYGFSLADLALTEAYVHPQSMASLGPIIFHPFNRCRWRSSALIRNNLSGVEWVSLEGSGGSHSLILIEDSKPVGGLEFKLEVSHPLNISLPRVGGETEDVNTACSRPVVKELYAKNMGDFPLDVQKIKVSGTDCGFGGFSVRNCSEFVLKPGQSQMLLVSYLSDFSGSMAHGDLEISLGSGRIIIPMKASVPIYTLELCRKSLFWARVKKLFGSFLVVAPFLCLVFFSAFPRSTSFWSMVFHYKGKRESIGIIPSMGKASSIKGNRKSSNFISPPPKVDMFPPVDEEEPALQGSVRVTDDCQITPQKQPENSPCNSLKEREIPNSVSSEGDNVLGTSQLGNLTVKIGKEKGRRRRKRKGASSVLTGLFEVSSSHSGNSTPSSPLSPISSGTPRRIWPLSPDGDKTPLLKTGSAQETTSSVAGLAVPQAPVFNEGRWTFPQELKPSLVPEKPKSKPVLLPSATFPSAGRPVPSMHFSSPAAAAAAIIAPYARAPGSKLHGEKGVKPQEKPSPDNMFTYDIWGDHLSRLNLGSRGWSVGGSAVTPRANATNSDSDSFFVRGPQALMTKYRQESVCLNKAVNG